MNCSTSFKGIDILEEPYKISSGSMMSGLMSRVSDSDKRRKSHRISDLTPQIQSIHIHKNGDHRPLEPGRSIIRKISGERFED